MFVLQQKEHPKFKRKGDDLFVEHSLSLTEALCGFQFPLTHLDGRQLLIKSNPGEVIKPGKDFRPAMLCPFILAWWKSFDPNLGLAKLVCRVSPGQFKAINDEGMPIYQRPFMKGKLYMHFSVEFPESISPEQCSLLESILPSRPSGQMTDMEIDECEETTLHDVNIEEEMRRKQQAQQEAYEEDEEGAGPRVQCAQQ